MQRKMLVCFVLPLFVGLAACSQKPAANAAAPASMSGAPVPDGLYRVTATIQDIMDAEIDPAADFLWGSVGFIATKAGVEDRQPRTDKEWETVRNNVIILIEATNLLVIPGRQVATTGSRLDPSEVAGIDDPKDIQKAIEANRDAFIGYAHGLYDAGTEMLAAIDKKNIAGMGAAGEKLDAACEACHRAYWYPKAVEPTQDPNAK
jgi:hypothetical protein